MNALLNRPNEFVNSGQATMNKLRILLADDHAIVREGLKMLIGVQPDMEVIGEAGDGDMAWRQTKALLPDIVVMDVSMPEMNGAQATQRLKVLCPNVKVIALSAYADEIHVRQLLAAGAVGYVLKRTIAEELTKAIRTVAAGGTYLDPAIAGKIVGTYINGNSNSNSNSNISPREHEVLLDIARGYTNKEIAARLHLSVKTVEGHKTRIMSKLDLQSRAGIVRYALDKGWLQDGTH
jgi:two-component system response regulator NreC